MATSTLIQRLEAGETGVSHRFQTEVFLASATVAKGDAVAFDLSKTSDGDKMLYVIKADTDVATSTCVVGVVVGSAQSDGKLTAGAKVSVLTSGLVSANVDGSTVAGSRLVCGATAGQLALAADIVESGIATVVQRPIVAIAAEADTANVAKVFFIKQF